MNSYSKKQLRITIKLATNIFKSTGSNTLILEGFRADVTINKTGGAQMSQAIIKIFGISQEDMNDATTLIWKGNNLSHNVIEVYALDENNSYTTMVFAGDIIQAWGYYQEMPNVYLNIQAQTAFYDAQKVFHSTSYNGSVDVATAIKNIANELGYHFENNGVTARINNLYQSNTGIEQIRNIAIAAGIDLYFDNYTIAICNKGTPRLNFTTEISEATGLIGYPTFDGLGVDLSILFNPEVTFAGKIKVKTDIELANGEWVVTSLTHYLQSEYPEGEWFSMVRGSYHGFAVPA